MAKNLFVDTDNNRLLAGSLTTQIATRPVFYGATAETVTVDLIERDSLQNLLNLAQPSGTTVALRVGVPGNVISVPSLSAISQAGITATATCSLFSTTTALGTASLYSGVTATATASLFGNITALATAVVTQGTACTLSLTVASVILPHLAMGVVSSGQNLTSVVSIEDSATTVGTISTSSAGIKFITKNATTAGTRFVEIINQGQNLYGSPQVYFHFNWLLAGSTQVACDNISEKFSFANGRLVSVNPDFLLTPLAYSGASSFVVIFVPDPNFTDPALSVSVASAGTGFPDNVNIAFSIPSDEDDGIACAGTMRAVNGSIVTATVTCVGSRFSSSTTTGKEHGILPAYRLDSISVTCAGAGYFGAAPSVTIDTTFLDTSLAGSTPAQAVAVTKADGSVLLQITGRGYGYTTAPGIVVAAPRLADAVRTASLTNTPTGYALGTYACDVEAPGAGTSAVINLIVTAGGSGLQVANAGFGYTTPPVITAPAPNLTGSVQAVSVSCQGAGYTTAPTVTFTGDGTGVAGTAVLSGGRVVGVTITTYGSGYTSAPTVTFAAPTNQGRIQSISVVSGGTNYTTAPAVFFAGSGGAAATAVIANGTVTSISLSEAGSGYAAAPVVTLGASPSRTVYSGVLTVTTAFVNAILPSTTVTVQVQATTTVGTSTLLQVPGTVAASL